ncbi:MAG: glycoside hydrolase family 32 protein, partial [Candidatus Omnitrophica bacterium]|nr:glycoside hydrolase family 32 protein [Candidatus Omnitrophota bacterium]
DRGEPGDPNGAFYANGRYHLMYLYKNNITGFCWGHVSSRDMLHWRYHPDAIGPGDGDEGCFSGGAFVDPPGRAILSYWQLWGARGIGLAESTDENYDHWKKSPLNPVIPSTEWGITAVTNKNGEEVVYGSADPSNIWMKDGLYYMLTGNLLVLNKYGRKPDSPPDMQGDRLYLFKSSDLKQWEYMHPFYESNRQWTESSEDNMCPSFLPLPSSPAGGPPSGKHLLLFISHNKGCQYYIGRYENDRFYPENHGRMTWEDNAYFAPEALIDGDGRQIMWAWIFDDRPEDIKNASGWSGTYGLPRSLWLGDDGALRMRPIEELKNLRLTEKKKENLTIKDGVALNLDGWGGELMELEITMQPGEAKQCGVVVGCSEDDREQTRLYYDAVDRKLKCDATRSSLGFGRKIVEGGPFELRDGEPLVLRVFVDKSIVEAYANDRQAVARSIYPTLGGRGAALFSEGGDAIVTSIRAWDLMPSNPF